GAAAGEDALVALVLAEHVHAMGLELDDRRLVGVAVDHEGVMNDVREPAPARLAPEDDVIGTRLEEHEMGIFFLRLRHEFEPKNLGIESAAALEIADRNGHMQDAFGPDHGRSLMAR